MTSTSGIISALQQFRGNSPFDPDFTGVGTSAIGFSTYASMYTYYRCYGSRIRVQWCNVGASAATQVIQVGVSASPTVSPGYTNMDQLMENPYGVVKIFAFGTNVPVTKMYMSTAKIEGVHKKAVATDDTYASLTTTNPAQPWYWNLITQSADQVSSSTAIAFVTITYYCEFYGRQVLTT